MARITRKEEIQERKDELLLWKQARRDLVGGGVQSYKIHNRELTYLNLTEINRMIKMLENEIDELELGRIGSIPVMPVVFRDM